MEKPKRSYKDWVVPGTSQSETLVSDIESTEVTGYGPTKSKKRHLSGSLQKPESAEITKGSRVTTPGNKPEVSLNELKELIAQIAGNHKELAEKVKITRCGCKTHWKHKAMSEDESSLGNFHSVWAILEQSQHVSRYRHLSQYRCSCQRDSWYRQGCSSLE